MELAPGTMVTANVRLVERLAKGGMGSIWLADHLGLESRVAVKFIAPELIGREPTLRERFKREAGICARLRSQHVVQIFDHGAGPDGTQYIVMELLEGATLTRLVEEKRRMTPREVGIIVAQVCKVLNRAHQIGIVHRDIKPDNIFLSDSDEELFVKVLDFGIAKHTRTQRGGDVVTATGAIVGSPEFMSPEQAINSKDVDHRTDLFSLAVVAYYALTGELPFEENDERPFWILLSSGEFVPPTKRVPRLPQAIDGWFHRALAPKPNERFQTAREMSEAFARVLAHVKAEEEEPEIFVEDERATIPAQLFEEEVDWSDQATVRLRPSDLRAALRHIPPPVPVPHEARSRLESAPTQHMSPQYELPSDRSAELAPPWLAPAPKRSTWPLIVLAVLLLAITALVALLLSRA